MSDFLQKYEFWLKSQPDVDDKVRKELPMLVKKMGMDILGIHDFFRFSITPQWLGHLLIEAEKSTGFNNLSKAKSTTLKKQNDLRAAWASYSKFMGSLSPEERIPLRDWKTNPFKTFK